MIPLSQLEIKHTDGNELEFVHSGEDYIGFYIATADGEYYSGTNNILLGLPLRIRVVDMDKNPQPTKNVLKFNLFKQKIKQYLANTLPVPVVKKFPSEIDYDRGHMIRYFAKRIHNTGYFEIEKKVYDEIKSKNGTYDHNLYETGRIKWYLKDNVFKLNALSIEATERNFPNISYLYPILNEFFRPTLATQENLYTDGGELYYADGTEYIGDYHIHSSQGPMEGAIHTNTPHSKLYYLKQLPTPNNQSYEDWLSDYKLDLGGIPLAMPNRGDGIVDPDPTILENQSNPHTSYNCQAMWTAAPIGYQGMTNSQGLVPRGTSCVDPEDGSGTYSYTEYGEDALSTCETKCSELQLLLDPLNGDSSTLTPTEGSGCMFPWDWNYCASCMIHQVEMCANTYSTSAYPGACFCGNFGGYKWYHPSCCG